MSRTAAFHIAILALLAIQPAGSAWAELSAGDSPERPVLQYSIVGSSSCETSPCYSGVMQDVAVQKFLLELANNPQGVHTEKAAALEVAEAIPDLLALQLIRLDAELYRLNFALFTAADVDRIRQVSEVYARSLAAALLAQRTQIEGLLGEYNAPGVDPKAVAYFLLGCVSLDWDGLDLTAAMGYRKTSGERPDGKYVPHAQERADETLKGIYWGSHNETYDGIRVTSFGDHHSLPRNMLPDVFWRIPGFPSSYPRTLKIALSNFVADSFALRAQEFLRIMLALRDGEKSAEDLALTLSVEEGDTRVLLDVLLALEYISEHDGLYRARIPVLTARDEVMARSILAIGNQVMATWLSENYPRMKDELQDLGFARAGVPFEDGYTMIWHYLFGLANRELVEGGLFADPYAPDRTYQGAIPAVYTLELQAP